MVGQQAVHWPIEYATNPVTAGTGSEDGNHGGQASRNLDSASMGGHLRSSPHRHGYTSEPLVGVWRWFEGCCCFIHFTTACFNKTPHNLLLDTQGCTAWRTVADAIPPGESLNRSCVNRNTPPPLSKTAG